MLVPKFSLNKRTFPVQSLCKWKALFRRVGSQFFAYKRTFFKVKSVHEPSGRSGRRSGFCSMKRLEIEFCYFSLDGMLVHHKVTLPPPQHYDRRNPFIHLGEERQCGQAKFLVKGHNKTAETRLEPPTSRSKVTR